MPTVHAEADTSSILISTPTPVMIESMSMMSAPVGPVEPLVVLNSESTLYATAPSPAPSEPMITPVQVTQDPIMVVAPTLIIDSVAPTPVVTNSIFDSIMSPGEPAPAMIPQEIIPVAITPAPVVVAPSAPLSGAPVVFSSTHNFSTPREFIEKSIANIDTMLVNIDGRHTAKEIEEESYRIEKLRFTDLEKNAHTEKIIMDKETDHAIHMRKILETELERDKANKATEETHANHVESTLTEIGTEHPVHRHAHKKTDPHLHEESPVIA